MTKFSSGFACKTGVLMVLVLLIVALALFSPGRETLTAQEVPVASAAVSDGTMLESGYGAQFGTNALRLTENADFYTASGSAQYSASGIDFGTSDTTVSSKVLLSVGPSDPIAGNYYSNLSSTAAVAYALYNPDINVDATFRVTLRTISAVSTAFDVQLNIKYGNIAAETETVNIPVGASAYEGNWSVGISLPGIVPVSGQPSFEVSVTAKSPSDSNKFSITQASLEITSEVRELSVDQVNAGIGLTVSGANRTTVSIPNIYTGEGIEALGNLFVKAGDVITVTMSLLATDDSGAAVKHEFNYAFAAALGRIGQSCVDWYTFYNGNYSSSDTYLERIDSQKSVYMPVTGLEGELNEKNIFYGYSASFTVKSGVANATTINLVPRVPRGITSTGGYIYQNAPESNFITVKVDNSAPSAPIIDPASGLGKTIASGSWYTTSSQVRLDYSNGGASGATKSSEFVYAFIVDKNIDASSINFTAYDFTPSLNNYPLDCGYSYSVNGVTYVANRQQLGVYENSANYTGRNSLMFNEPGEYGLLLIAVDAAGNRSEPTVYSALQYNSVKADWTTRSVGAYFSHAGGTYVPNTSGFYTFASVYVLIGSAHHDADGNCTASPDVTTGDSASDANRSLIPVARDTYVTVRVVMTDQQANNYSLVRYALGNSISVQDPSYAVNSRGYRVYDITFRTDDAIWDLDSTTSRPVTVYFNRRMEIKLIEDDFTFSMTSWGVANQVLLDNDSFEVYFPDDPGAVIGVKPDIKVEYYKQITYYYYAYYEVINGANVITTGGYIEVEGMRYDFAPDESLLPYINGTTPFVTGEHSYQTYSNTGSYVYDSELKLARYTVIGYDVNAVRDDTGFKDAGDYFFRAYIDTADMTDYYGELFSTFTIKKAEPGVIDAYAESDLVYGDSLDALTILSKTETGQTITDSINILGRIFYKSALGVWGEYSITSPAPETQDYILHDVVSGLTITVKFIPIDINEFTMEQISAYYDQFFSEFVDEVRDSVGALTGYTLKEGMRTAQNFAEQTIEIKININHALAFVEADADTLEYYYDGNEKSVIPVVYRNDSSGNRVYLNDVSVIVEYKEESLPDTEYSSVLPSTAGRYDVRIVIDRAVNNYYSDYYIDTLVIHQRNLEVYVSDTVVEHTALDSDESIAGYGYRDILTYTYGYAATADYYSGYEEGGEFVTVDSLLYVFRFLKVYSFTQDGELEFVGDTSEWGEETPIVGASAFDAGWYIMQVRIDNVNNAGEKYILFRVNQAAVGSSTLDVRMPSVASNYNAVSVSGDTYGKIGNLEFGETLAEASASIIGDNGNARYTYSGYSVATLIDGRFIFESEAEYVRRNIEAGNYIELPLNGRGEEVLDIRYAMDGSFLPYSIRLIWQAGTVDDTGSFVPNTNFATYYYEVDIYVVRATADFGEVRLSDITYGDTLKNTVFSGAITSHGFTFGNDDYTLVIPEEDKDTVLGGGERVVRCVFTPSDALLARYLYLDDVEIPITVNKREADIVFVGITDITGEDFDGNAHRGVTHIYGKQYTAPGVAVSAAGNNLLLTLQFSYYREATAFDPVENIIEIEGKQLVKVEITPSTEVGKYYVLAEVVASNTDYYGSEFEEYYVIRATLTYAGGVLPEKSISYGDNISTVDFGSVQVSDGASYFTGRFEVVVSDGEGGYTADATLPVTTDTEYNSYIRFVPSGSVEAVERYEKNYRPYFVEYFLRIEKKDISSSISVEGLSHVYDNTEKSVVVSIPDPENEGEFLPYTVSYSDTPLYAGSYTVTVSVDDSVENYRGRVELEFVIKKSPVSFGNVTSIESPYNGLSYNFAPELSGLLAGFDYSALQVTVEYRYSDGTVLSSLPYRIGKYYVTATVDDRNFSGAYDGELLIIPNLNEEEPFTGLSQVYSAPGSGVAVASVAPNYNKIIIDGAVSEHPQVNYTVEYLINGVQSSNPPTEAGTYAVTLVFSEMGLVKSYDLKMVIAKAEAVFDVSDEYYRTYTADSVDFKVALPAGITEALYEFKPYDASGDYTLDIPVNAGAYAVRITLISNNYEGTAYTKLLIAKADPEITALPHVSGTIAFGTPSDEVAFVQGSGRVIFPVTGEEISGVFSVDTDISLHGVGKHTVTLKFTPDDGVNFNDAFETAEIEIIKRDLSKHITFKDDFVIENGVFVITYDYRAAEIAVNPCLDEEGADIVENIVSNYGEIKFIVNYNGQQSKPTAVNTSGYSVTVRVNDNNFGGDLTAAVLVIKEAMPIVSLPSFSVVNKGDMIDNSVIVPGTGYAYIENDSGKVDVRGTFTIDSQFHEIASKANENAVVVRFTPADTTSYLTVSVDADIYVNGLSVDLSGDIVRVTGSETYGAPLSSFIISLKEGSDAADIGTIAWADPDAVVGVGGMAEYVFTPFDANYGDYNVIRGTVKMDSIVKNSMKLTSASRAYVYSGDTLRNAVIELYMTYGENDIPVEGFKYTVAASSGSLDDVVNASYEGGYLGGVELIITVTHDDFEEFVARLEVYVYRKIAESDFNVGSSSKYYDGEPVGLDALGISASNTDYHLGTEDFRIDSILLNGAETDEISAAGVYTVTVVIDEGMTLGADGKYYYGKHKGSYTFEYTVSKRDISEYITVEGNDKVYADNSVRLKASFGEYDGKVNTASVIYRYYSADGSREYGVLPPTDAGNYKVIVSISGDDPSFTASKEFDYFIRRREATVRLEGSYNYTYNPSIPIDIVPEVSNNLTSDSYRIYYRKQGSSVESTDRPVEAGTYTVRVEIIDKNYTGSATATLTIAKADLEVADVPVLDSLQYGVKLGSSGITGGRVTSNLTGALVSGKFEFVDPDNDKLPVGSNTVSLRFVPDNSNYNETYVSVIIVIVKAHAALEDLSLTAVYNGKAQYPTFKTDLKLTYSFTQNGYNVDSAINAGDYLVTVVVNDKNYEGSKQVKFTITRASLIDEESVMPVAGAVEYGKSLSNSHLGGGSMVYIPGGSAVSGTYSYFNADTVLGDVAVYEGVQFVFTPQDTLNYEVYVGTVTVEVTKATATISVSGNVFTFGDILREPVFTTSPANMRVLNDVKFSEMDTVPRVGTYEFTATISDDNYQGSVVYAIYVNKKGIEIDYYRETSVVDRYSYTYGNTAAALPRIDIDTLVDIDELNYADIQGMILCKYYASSDNSGEIPSVVPPSSVGEYYVVATLNHPDYYITDDSARITYSITRATVSSITFDPDLLSNQIYGSVSVPVVVTSPAGVGVRIEFPGYENMPLSAGNYSIKAVIDDPNYFATELNAMFRINPKEISIENIKVQNKAYDGLPNVTVTGELYGVMVGDEVVLKMTATTMGNKSEVGTYQVVITSWTLGGLHAANYKVYEPVYSLMVKISTNKITDSATDSYITTPGGFSSNITVSFSKVYDTVNKSNFFTRILGQKATVQVIEVKENGMTTVLGEKVKFYAKIPDEYINSQNLVVEGLGNLSGVTEFTREGDYITFYADSSGEIVFYSNDFPYWVIIVIGAVVIIILGVIAVFVTAPIRKRKHVNAGARKIYKWSENRGSLEEQYTRELKAKHEAKKRRWRI